MEDFVTFELAKKLKEKGFNKRVRGYYWETGGLSICNTPMNSNALENEFSAPTISQVLKWLRDDNAMFVHISIYSKGWYCDVYTYEYYEEDREYGANHVVQLDEFATYEEAALAGIEYCLDDII